jgi:hypothetical protein
MKATRLLIGVLAVALAIVALSITPAAASKGASTTASIEFDPDDFVDEIDNEFFPLEPGTTMFYEGVSDGVPTSDIFEVTHDTKVILGVRTTVVHDRAFEEGVLVEETFDWFAQDEDGNVWYFGEDSRELDPEGNVISTEGSWEAGVDGAEPGIIMLADPRVGNRYHQEFAPGVAEDQAKVLSLDKSKCVPYGCFDELLLTKEWSRLDPGVVDHKYYAEGIGFILSVMVKGGEERLELVNITFEDDEED